MREIFATIKINRTSSFSFEEKRRISSSGSSGTIAVILLLSFINKYLLATIRSQGGFFNRSPIYFSFSLPPRRPSIDPDEDGSLLFLTAVAELGYYFTPRYSSSVGVFLKFLFFSPPPARTLDEPSNRRAKCRD